MALSLKTYTIVSTTLTGILAIAAFTRTTARPRFAEIDVERINVVERDGTVRMTISNAERSPGWVFHGKVVPGRPKQAGMIFYNDEGEENGGLIFGGRTVGGTPESFGHLSFDQYDQDQDMALEYSQERGTRTSGIGFYDRPDIPILELLDRQRAMAAMHDGPAKDSAMKALGGGVARRLFVGRSRDKRSLVELSDAANRPRLRLTVDSAGAASIEFLDETGKVIKRVTGD
jgi:hypothetical protein